jgi:ABC-type amino acid transport substrate-binding protein
MRRFQASAVTGHRSLVRLAAGALTALLSPTAPVAADLPEILARKTLRVLAVIDRERPEFFVDPPGAAPGFDRELVESFCRFHKLALVVVPQSSSEELIAALLAGRGDVIAGRFRASEERLRRMAFTVETFPSRLVVITRRPHRVVQSVQELREEKVGTIAGTVMVDELLKANLASDDIVRLGVGELPLALRAGRITAAVWGVEMAVAMKRQDPSIQLGMFLGPPGSIAWAVRKGDPALLAALDAHIEASRRSPAWSYLVVRYFGEAAPEILRRVRGDGP